MRNDWQHVVLTNPPSWEVFSAGFNTERFSVLKTLTIFNIITSLYQLLQALTLTYSLDTDEDAFFCVMANFGCPLDVISITTKQTGYVCEGLSRWD